MWLDKKKDSGQARMTGFWTSQNDKEKKGFCRFLTGEDRLSQRGQEVHALCDPSFPLVGNPSLLSTPNVVG